jgi:glycolate oxidase FAD binding subunit
VLGVTVVLGDGTVANSGGKVVKNVAGYDLGKLFCGSRGTLGLIARASLRLHPLPDAARTVVSSAPDAEDAARSVQAVLRAPLAPSAVDVLWPGRLAVLFEGSARAVEAQAAEVDGDDDPSVWGEAAARQAAAGGRLSFPPGELARTLAGLPEAVVRASAGVAYVPDAVPDAWSPLAERIRRELDPQGVFV